MPNISDVFVIDLSATIEHRETKWGICVSIGGKYLLINSNSHEKYDDFGIKKSTYEFLDHDSYIGCLNIFTVSDNLILRKLGNINYEDMNKILNKIKNSKRMPKLEKEMLAKELEEWLSNYSENKLNAAFNKR